MGDWRWPICQLQDFYSCLHVPEYHTASWRLQPAKWSPFHINWNVICLVLVIFLANLICTSSKAWAKRAHLQSRHENVTPSRIGHSDVFPCFTSSWTWGKKPCPEVSPLQPTSIIHFSTEEPPSHVRWVGLGYSEIIKLARLVERKNGM